LIGANLKELVLELKMAELSCDEAEQHEYSFSVGFVGDTQGYPDTAQ